jgi:hypothetical protein
MEELIPLAAVILIFGGGAAVLLSITPVGKAIAARIAGKKAPLDEDTAATIGELQREVDELRQVETHVAELGERVDFLERLVAQQREAERLPPAR